MSQEEPLMNGRNTNITKGTKTLIRVPLLKAVQKFMTTKTKTNLITGKSWRLAI